MNELLEKFQKKLNKELIETDFDSLYEDIDILGSVSEYDTISQMLEDEKISKEEKKELQKEINRIEKTLLLKNRLIKLKGEDKNYYCKRDTVYDNVGMAIEDNYTDYLEDDDIFCEYTGDLIYVYMKKILVKKMKKYREEDEYNY